VVTTVAETTTTVAVETTTTVAAEQATTTEAPYVPGGTLPKTGADDPGTIAWMAAGLLGAGTLIVALARRRRTA
jgi:LPXTG-motif cell wall-anchored protein